MAVTVRVNAMPNWLKIMQLLSENLNMIDIMKQITNFFSDFSKLKKALRQNTHSFLIRLSCG